MEKRNLTIAFILICGIIVAYFTVKLADGYSNHFQNINPIPEPQTTPTKSDSVAEGIDPQNKKYEQSLVRFKTEWLEGKVSQTTLKKEMDTNESTYDAAVENICESFKTCTSTSQNCTTFEKIGINTTNQIPGSQYVIGETKQSIYFRACYYHQTIDHTHTNVCFYDKNEKKFYLPEDHLTNGSTPDYYIQELTGEKTCPDPDDFGVFKN